MFNDVEFEKRRNDISILERYSNPDDENSFNELLALMSKKLEKGEAGGRLSGNLIVFIKKRQIYVKRFGIF
jgi:hypothetical protein